MRVLTDISGKAGQIATAWADRWLAASGGHQAARGRERSILFSAARIASLGLVVLLPSLSVFQSASVALPVGLASVAATFLIAATASIAWSRRSLPHLPAGAGAELPGASAPFSMLPYGLCPGLILLLDPQGLVLATGGRDRACYLASLAEPMGRGLLDQIHVSDRIAFLQALDDLRQGAPHATVLLRLEPPVAGRGRDGQFTPVRLDMTAETDGDGALSRVFCQLLDSTDEERLRREASRKRIEAEDANESKSRFLAAVSHELRTPLNAILGFSDILLGEYFGKLADDRQKEYVTLIRQSGGHLLSVVNTMLDMSKIEAGRYELFMEPFMAAEPIRACEEMLALQAREKGLTLTSRVQRDLGEVVADRRALSQVLINLLGNAIKFTRPGGVISIDAARDNGMLNIAISDTGIGIAADKLAMLGQPFLQIQNAYTRSHEGTGLGLSLVKGLISLHGGTFHIASQPGEGTVITVSIPDNGSGGAPGAYEDALRDQPVEFPPRLSGMRKPAEEQHEGISHGTAKAQSA